MIDDFFQELVNNLNGFVLYESIDEFGHAIITSKDPIKIGKTDVNLKGFIQIWGIGYGDKLECINSNNKIMEGNEDTVFPDFPNDIGIDINLNAIIHSKIIGSFETNIGKFFIKDIDYKEKTITIGSRISINKEIYFFMHSLPDLTGIHVNLTDRKYSLKNEYPIAVTNTIQIGNTTALLFGKTMLRTLKYVDKYMYYFTNPSIKLNAMWKHNNALFIIELGIFDLNIDLASKNDTIGELIEWLPNKLKD